MDATINRFDISVIYRAYTDVAQFAIGSITIDKENNKLTIDSNGSLININTSSKTIAYGAESRNVGIIEVIGYK